jgi:hypothetical protein
MVDVVIRFFKFELMSTHPMIFWGIGVVCLLLIITAFFSISSYPIPWWRKFLWGIFILALPILGLAIYAVRCLILGDWSLLQMVFAKGPASASQKPS